MFSSILKYFNKYFIYLHVITKARKVNKNTKERGALWLKEGCFLKE